MKIIAIGDIHGRTTWKDIVNKEEDADLIVFIGDYFDSFDISYEEQMSNFLEILDYKNRNTDKVKLLIGNHDQPYFPEVKEKGVSGHQYIHSFDIGKVLSENRDLFQMCYRYKNIVFSHAGVSNTFMNETFGLGKWDLKHLERDLNELFKHNPNKFSFASNSKKFYADPYGDDFFQTPIWIRPNSLMHDNRGNLNKRIIQVVGHTGQSSLYISKRYCLIDCLEKKEYLIYKEENNEGEFSKGKI